MTAEHDAERREQVRVVAEILRGVLRAALACGIAGLLVAGIGGRVVMRLAAAMNPAATGLRTENGELIGEITVNGTVALLLFGGLLSGLVGSVVWIAVRAWIPGAGMRRALLAAPIAAAVAGVALVRSDSRDFAILRSDFAIAAMLLALVGAFGFCVALLDERLDRRLPRPGADPANYALAALGLVMLGGVMSLPVAVAAFFSERACLCAIAPLPLGVPLLVAGGATLAWWVQQTRGRPHPSALVRFAGRAGLIGSVALGGSIVATEVAALQL
jgi:hypothetical protein